MDKPINDIPKERRKSFRSKKKFHEKLQIRKMLKDGYTDQEIMAQLNIKKDITYWVRRDEIRSEDNEIIKKKLLEDGGSYLVTDLSTLDARLGDAIKFCDALIESKDPKVSPFLKLEAEKFRVDVSVWKFKLQVEGPRVIDEATKPVRKVVEGEFKPLQALQHLPKLQSATTEQKENLKKWAERAREEKVIEDSAEEKGQDSA